MSRGTQNKIEDLRNHLFAQLERLGDESLSDEAMQKEIERSKAISDVSQVVINSAKLEVDYMKHVGGRPATGFIPEEPPVRLPGSPLRAIGN